MFEKLANVLIENLIQEKNKLIQELKLNTNNANEKRKRLNEIQRELDCLLNKK